MLQESDESFGEKKLKKRGRPPSLTARKVCDKCTTDVCLSHHTINFAHESSLSDRLHSLIGVEVEEVGSIKPIKEEKKNRSH